MQWMTYTTFVHFFSELQASIMGENREESHLKKNERTLIRALNPK